MIAYMYIMRKKNNINEKGLNIMDLNDKQKNFVDLCYKEFGDDLKEITRKQLVQVMMFITTLNQILKLLIKFMMKTPLLKKVS